MKTKYDDFLGVSSSVVADQLTNAGSNKRGRKSDDRPILRPKTGFEYHMVLLPYIHGPKGHPPIIAVPMHYAFSPAFPCLKENGLDEKCAMEGLVQNLWNEWREHKKQGNDAACKATLSEINKCRAQTRYYSPVRVVNVNRSGTDEVAEDELKKYKNRTVWWSFASSAQLVLIKSYKEYGSLHNPMDPALIKLEMVNVMEEGRKASYPRPTIMVKMSREKGAFAIVKNDAELEALVETVAPIMEAGVFSVLSNEKIAALVKQNFSVSAGGTIARKRQEADRFEPAELEPQVDAAAQQASDEMERDTGSSEEPDGAKQQLMDEIDQIFGPEG